MNENQKRTIHYSFKATPEEDEIIQKKMELTGIKNQSAFIRRIVLGGLILRLDLPELKNATRLMGNLSNNVNQIARRLHEGGSIYELNHSHPSLTPTVPQMARELNISRNTAYELTKQKGFPCFRVGKRVLINRDMLQAWLDEQCSRTA